MRPLSVWVRSREHCCHTALVMAVMTLPHTVWTIISQLSLCETVRNTAEQSASWELPLVPEAFGLFHSKVLIQHSYAACSNTSRVGGWALIFPVHYSWLIAVGWSSDWSSLVLSKKGKNYSASIFPSPHGGQVDSICFALFTQWSHIILAAELIKDFRKWCFEILPRQILPRNMEQKTHLSLFDDWMFNYH